MKYLILSLLVFSISFSAVGQHKEIVKPRKAPAMSYPFSMGVISNGLLFVSGQVGTDPQTSKVVAGGIEAETEQTILNIKGILEDAGASLDDVVSVTVYLSNMDDFAKMNTVYKKYFKEGAYPARTTVGVAKLVFGASVEMTMTAAMPKKK
ncbi:RidA family protein [Spirosoma foliorum]|uniref:RidA family protein n=1 Tax=Spirosoma foliorum TaxID=2710596 RepID=A0A7G5GXW8_9BACT|nr:RidA family protein [Spirosoma foliorum]QMW03710.1 RidA family protein [Spirosoma foliorum]